MNGKERRLKLLNMLSLNDGPIAGSKLATELNVSRQVIVQDIALLRAEKHNIASTNSGYLLLSLEKPSRVFKIRHTEEQAEDEMNTIVDNGGMLEDVFVYHKKYGIVRADLNIRNRRDVKLFLDDIVSGKSTFLMNITSGYHYHTVSSDDYESLDVIQELLWEKGYLAPLQEYEPVDFRAQQENR